MYRKRLHKSFQQSLLDNPVPKLAYDKKSKRIKALPPPLVPTQYVPPVPKPKPRTKQPVALPRTPKPVINLEKNLIMSKYVDSSKIVKNLNVFINKKERAFKNYAKTFDVSIVAKEDISKQLFNTRSDVFKLLENELSKDKGIKVEISLKVLMKKKEETGEVIFDSPYFNCSIFTITNKYEIQIALDKAGEEIKKRAGQWLSKGSGWIIEEIQEHHISIVKYTPLRGSSYLLLSKELRHPMHGLINLKNNDNKCVIWNLVRHLNPRKNHPERISASDYEFIKKLDLSGITFPLTINQIPLIEKRNNININLFGYEEKKPFPIYISKAKYIDHIEMLYIEGEERQHYVHIKDFNRFMYPFTKHKGKKNFCMNCLQCFYSQESQAKHREYCIAINGVQAVKMPKPYIDKNGVERAPCLYFKNHHRQLPVPFVIYADFESVTEKVSSCQQSDNKSYTEQYQKHTACSFGYKVVCHYDKKYSGDLKIYRGEDCINRFMKSMFDEVTNCQNIIKKHFNKPLQMTSEDEDNFQNANSCHICNKRYKSHKGLKKDEEPVRDHCHITGKYRGSAHAACNLKLQISAEKIRIPVIFHNLRGYDSHFIINELGKLISEGENFTVNVIPNNTEKYMAFYIGKHLAFIDSFQFMSSSIEKLASNLPKDKFIYTGEYYTNKDQLHLVKAKGVYPYDYMDSISKFNDTKLPSQKDFYSLLNDEHIIKRL